MTMTKADMYDKKTGKSILPKITLKKYMPRSKYDPRTEDIKHAKQRKRNEN